MASEKIKILGAVLQGRNHGKNLGAKVSFFGLCSKMKIIPIKNFNIKKVVLQFLPFFRLKCWFKGQTISRIHLRLPNAYKLMCFDRNINGNRDVKFLIGIIGHSTDQRKLLYLCNGGQNLTPLVAIGLKYLKI
jgi:hypothetical protein